MPESDRQGFSYNGTQHRGIPLALERGIQPRGREGEGKVQMSSDWNWFYFPSFSGLGGFLFASVGKSRRRGRLLMHGGAIGRFAGGRGRKRTGSSVDLSDRAV